MIRNPASARTNGERSGLLHFSGHGAGAQGLCFLGEDGGVLCVSSDGLGQVIRAAGDRIKLIVLNACYTKVQVESLVAHVPCVIGMPHAIGDRAALVYAADLYRALAFGRSVAIAHQCGLAALALHSTSGLTRDVELAETALHAPIPEMWIHIGVDPKQLLIVHDVEDSRLHSKASMGSRIHLEIDIEADLDTIGAETLAKIVAEVCRLGGGKAARIVCVTKGSVRLTLSLDPESAHNLMKLRADGELATICDLKINNIDDIGRCQSRVAIDDNKTRSDEAASGTAAQASVSAPTAPPNADRTAAGTAPPTRATDTHSGPAVPGAAPAPSSQAVDPARPGEGGSVAHPAPRRSPARAAAKKHIILFLAANPSETGRLALDREARSIHVELKRSGYRDRFDFVTRWAAEPLDLLRELRELRPTIVHFSGHGSRSATAVNPAQGREVLVAAASTTDEPGGLSFHSAAGGAQVVSSEAIARTITAAGAPVRLVVLNACFTEPIAEALLPHVDCVVGMSGAIYDEAARSFAIGFYGGLGEHESIAAAFAQGKAAIDLEGLADVERPRLQVRKGLDATQLILAAAVPSVIVDVPCPYPGMRPFAADDAGSFHGRDIEIADLIGRLRAGEREIFVIGPSGSGKSSLMTAGVLPRLARGVAGVGPFVVRELRPGEHPAARLGQLLDQPEGEPLVAAARVAGLLAHRGPGATLLVVVDQLEELFTLASRDERMRFLDALRALRKERRCTVVFTLRADFFGALMESPLWAERCGQLSRVEVSPLRGEALREAIAAPAHAVGVAIEPELIERLLADAASEPGILPLLQDTMVQLWDMRVAQTLTLAGYHALGDGDRSGLAVALARRADATLHRLTAAQTAIARRISLRLISFGEGRSNTRRQQPLSKLRAVADCAADFSYVLQQMIEDRLLTIDEDHSDGEPRVDLCHEILIVAWPTLAGWIRSYYVDEQRRRQFEAAAAQWVEHGHGDRGLLDQSELADAELWQQTESALSLGQSVEVMELIVASRALQTRQRRRRRGLLAAVFIAIASIVALFIYLPKDRDARIAAQAHKMRTTAGTALAKIDERLATQASPYLELQPYFVSLSDELARNYDVQHIRDELWERFHSLRSKTTLTTRREEIDTYSALLSHLPAAASIYVEATARQSEFETRVSESYLAASEQFILSLEGKRNTYTTPTLGNALRVIAKEHSDALRAGSKSILKPAWTCLSHMTLLLDAEILREGQSDTMPNTSPCRTGH